MQLKTFISDEKHFMRPAELAKFYGVSRSTISRLLRRMKTTPFAVGYRRYSATLVLVDVRKFQEFMLSLDGAYLKLVK